ncbi:hypothetical protein [Geomonas propionica]|uniref:Sporulation protein n=1 Tax=Geomonas propionica TaxID=2798582 RepID=A0ABS0YT34_9BACT|nr:hypothetical protein [Geomonas propionica]MBJ6801136.1 hypothetical protein [Geomonas propionica]
MELKDFISETLSQLIEGVIDAQTKVMKPGSSGGRVSPHVRTPDVKSLYGVTNDNLPVIFVDFDISVEAQEGKGTKGGIGVVAGMFTLGSQGESKENVQTSNKIRFKIPVALPLQPYKED